VFRDQQDYVPKTAKTEADACIVIEVSPSSSLASVMLRQTWNSRRGERFFFTENQRSREITSGQANRALKQRNPYFLVSSYWRL